MRKALCLLVSLILCFLLVACNGADTGVSDNKTANTAEIGNEQISLLYSASDCFNPYTAKTKSNRELSKLLYDPLIKCDNQFNPQFFLASGAVLEGKTCTVTLKSAYFTDGTAVTAEDIIYSYNLAKRSETAYGASLYEVQSISGSGNTVIFNLSVIDPYFLNLLDFPIIKTSSDGNKNSDGVEIAPVGCGRYTVSEDGSSLLRNGNYYGNMGDIATINLIDAPDENSVSHYVEVGAADIYYADQSSPDVARMSGKRADVNTNNFVYIGINGAYAPLKSNLLRYALSAAIDREEICHSAYFDNAVPANGFFNPAINETSAIQSLKSKADLQITVENLEKIGYNRLDNGYYVNSSGKRLSLTLLVNSDNQSRLTAANLIKKECKEAGIEINIIPRSYGDYVSMLSSGNFQLYLGEVKVLRNMDLKGLTVSGGSAAYGVSPAVIDESTGAEVKSPCEEIISRYHSGECSLSDVAGVLITEMPQIPVCYRKGMLFYTARIKNSAEPSASDIFYGFENYKLK